MGEGEGEGCKAKGGVSELGETSEFGEKENGAIGWMAARSTRGTGETNAKKHESAAGRQAGGQVQVHTQQDTAAARRTEEIKS